MSTQVKPVSPRARAAASALVRAAQALGRVRGRTFVIPDDVKAARATPVLAHRVLLTPDAELNRYSAAQLAREVLDATPALGIPLR